VTVASVTWQHGKRHDSKRLGRGKPQELHSRHGSGGRYEARTAVQALRSDNYWTIGVIQAPTAGSSNVWRIEVKADQTARVDLGVRGLQTLSVHPAELPVFTGVGFEVFGSIALMRMTS